MSNQFKVSTDRLVEMIRQITVALQDGKASIQNFIEIKAFMESHLDKLNLSPLLQGVRTIGRERDFNAYMALLNKYLGMSKDLIPFELDLQDYVHADKIMMKISQ